MNDDQMDDMLIQGVRDYNAPGAVPRDEMWREIQRTRLERKQAAIAAVSVTRIRERRWWLLPSVGIAAAMLLAVGIGIGSFLQRRAPATAPVVAAAPVIQAPVAQAPISPVADSSTVTPAPDTSTVAIVRKLHEATRNTDASVRALASANPPASSETRRSPAGGSSTAPGTAPGAAPTLAPNQSLAYRLVVLQHLAGSEAMITSFRSSARSGELDGELKNWSRELLGTTRLLEASQASDDPVMKRLLEDLDLVISQIVQYTTRGTTDTEELDLIEQSINKRGVMSKLRGTIPNRGFPVGT
jgi:hypothetical protein